ncbi:hypothetical protein CCP3SC1_190011 [Gammaproteobacteria bacterium]
MKGVRRCRLSRGKKRIVRKGYMSLVVCKIYVLNVRFFVSICVAVLVGRSWWCS